MANRKMIQTMQMRVLFYWFLFRSRKEEVFIPLIFIFICTQMQCSLPIRDTRGIENTTSDLGPNVKVSEREKLQLKLGSDKSQLAPGDCADLHLDVYNPSSHSIHWNGNWIFEQEGPTPPLPEAWPRGDIEIAPNTLTTIICIRICHEHLVAGANRFRISTPPTSTDPPRSNWVTFEVLSRAGSTNGQATQNRL
jgi:hypothetical protein